MRLGDSRRPTFRTVLVTALIVLAILIAALIGSVSAYNIASGTRSVLDATLAEVAQHTVGQTQNMLSIAPPLLTLSAATFKDAASLHGGYRLSVDSEVARGRLKYFVDVLWAHPGIDNIYYADRFGDTYGAYRKLDGNVVARITRPQRGAMVGWVVTSRVPGVVGTLDKDFIWTPLPPTPRYFYSPLKRAWYTQALAQRRLVWTPPYLYTDGDYGLTVSLPRFNDAGEMSGVFGVDIRLLKLSEFVRRLPSDVPGLVFITDTHGLLIASRELATRVAKITIDKMRYASQSVEPVIRAVARDTAISSEVGERASEVSVDGRRWFAIAVPINVSAGLSWIVYVAVPRNALMWRLDVNNLTAVAISALALGLAIWMGIRIGHSIARPLHHFAAEMEQVAEFEIPEDAAHRSMIREVQTMADALDRMKAGLRSFGRYVPTDLVRTLIRTNTVAELGGEHARVTLFFADVVGFTTMSERLTTDELVGLLADYFDVMEQIVTDRGGIVDKYIGDCLMAFFGAPLRPLEDPEQRACEAALDFQDAFARLRVRQEERGKPCFDVRVGIHSGEALVGNIGSKRRLNYTAIGDTVNTCSRVEGLTRQYLTHIIVTEATRAYLSDAIALRELDKVVVKGRVQAVTIYDVVGRSAALTSEQAEMMTAYASGLLAYRERQFETAHAFFTQALSFVPHDGPSAVMRARCEEFMQTAPPLDWQTIYVARSK